MEKKIETNKSDGKNAREIFGNISIVSSSTGEVNKDFTKKMLEKFAEKFQ